MRTLEAIERDVDSDGKVDIDVYELRLLLNIARAARFKTAKYSACVMGPSLKQAVAEAEKAGLFKVEETNENDW